MFSSVLIGYLMGSGAWLALFVFLALFYTARAIFLSLANAYANYANYAIKHFKPKPPPPPPSYTWLYIYSTIVIALAILWVVTGQAGHNP